LVRWNLSPAALYEEAIRREEGLLAANGPLACRTGQHTGRSPNDKFVVREPSSDAHIAWGNVNRPMAPSQFDALHHEMISSLKGKELYVLDCFAGADPQYRLPVRVITEYAWHSLFARNLFIIDPAATHVPEFTVIDVPSFRADPGRHGSRGETVIAVNLAKKLVLIASTSYAGEMKKSIFSILNYILPLRGVLSMHCSANLGPSGDTALFFGLSGTGKTTLSSDPERMLIGDDEHGWSDRGIFNFEGGCYAKVINLSPGMEPEIHATTGMFGTILENVGMDIEERRIDLNDATLTENTRASYPLSFIPRVAPRGAVGHPKHIVMLTADAFGVLPPISEMTTDQAMYHFLSGYTAKLAGTERGVAEPQATFSTCFGGPFMALAPSVYAKLLGEKIAVHNVKVWLVNTGWTGGPYGTGHRMEIGYTKAMLRAALSGKLGGVEFQVDPVFGLRVPGSCPDVPPGVLDPRSTWKDPAAYDRTARKLAGMFHENFAQYADQVTPGVRASGFRKTG
jgi:phosphoenolpyruvate carboxykinase (ATP)